MKKRGKPVGRRQVNNESERIGLTIRTYRECLGITGAQLAKALNVAGSTYDGYEAGARRMTYEQVMEVAQFFTFHLRMELNSNILIQPESIATPNSEGVRDAQTLSVAA